MATTERAAPIFPAGLFIGNILQGRPRGAVESGRAGGRKEGKITRKKRKHRRRKGEGGGERKRQRERKKERREDSLYLMAHHLRPRLPAN